MKWFAMLPLTLTFVISIAIIPSHLHTNICNLHTYYLKLLHILYQHFSSKSHNKYTIPTLKKNTLLSTFDLSPPHNPSIKLIFGLYSGKS
jgi:hypothetical protein